MALALHPAAPRGRPTLEDLADELATDPCCVHVEHIAARPARDAEPRLALPEPLRRRLGVDRLWSHQAEAIDLIRAGTSVVVATGTASGKSLCYQAPIGETVLDATRPGTALALFPTKALAQDQLRSFGELDLPGLVAVTYDGDTGPEARTWGRANANVVLTNPEMLHVGLLPHHARWATFLMRLRYVVVDELHELRGVFGSHVAHLLRRLRRVCAHYGSDPTFVFCSATIGDPAVLASDLCGKPVEAVVDDGSPRAARLFVLWDPHAEGTGPHDTRPGSANRATAQLTARLVREGYRTIAFCRSRRTTETVAADVRRRLPRSLASAVRPYRGGYLTAERRAVERQLFGGGLRGVVATSALELGIDVGGLDACVLDGFPGTIASLWQQVGRAGRGAGDAVAVLVAGDDQLDRWFLRHPGELFSRPPEPAVANPANDAVLLPHLACAAYELPLRPGDERWWPDLLDDGVRRLVLDDRLRLRPRQGPGPAEPAGYWAGRGRPGDGLGLRNGGADQIEIVGTDGRLVGTVDRARAHRQVHPGAVYLHQGVSYRVTELDLDEGTATVVETLDQEYTQPRSSTTLELLDSEDTTRVGRALLGLGPVLVRSHVTGYRRYDARRGTLLGVEDLDLPPTELRTRGFWYVFDDPTLAAAELHDHAVPGALHALEHAAIGIMPLFTICDRWDVGGVSTPWLPETQQATVVIYDGYPGGAGIAELGFRFAGEHLRATLEVVEACECAEGCPSCVQSPKCGNGNEPLDKAGAARLLSAVLG